jgi:hypothetical protein
MKKSIILSIIGLTVATTVSHAGSIPFDTYTANYGSGIITTYGDGPLVGQGINNSFTGVLLFSVNPIVEAATTSLVSASNPLNPNWSVGSTGTFDMYADPGYITAPNFNYPGSQTSLYFEVAAFSGPSYNTSSVRGHSASFTANLVFGTTLPTPDQLDNMQPFQVFGAPEPTTLALGGLGLASLFHFRRKQV